MAAQNLSQDENIFSGFLFGELIFDLDNAFPLDFINNVCEELIRKINSMSREKIYSTCYSHVVHIQFAQVNNIVILINLGDLLEINLDKNKHDFSGKIRDQSVTENKIHGLQFLGGYVDITPILSFFLDICFFFN